MNEIEHQYDTFCAHAHFFLALVLALVFSFVAQGIAHSQAVTTEVCYAVFAAFVLWAAFRQPAAMRQMLLGRLQMPKLFLYAILTGVGLPLMLLVAARYFPQIGWRFGYSWTEAPPLLLALFLAPLVETAVFQIWMQSGLSRRPWFSILASSALFVGIHLRIDVELVALAVAFSSLRVATGSSGVVLLSHVLANVIALATPNT